MKVCCSSAASLCYWLVVSLAAWAVLATLGTFWHPLRAHPGATCLLAVGIGCVANALKNRTFHCLFTGPLFLIAAALLFASGLTRGRSNLIWIMVLAGTGVAFLLEWRYSRKPSGACETDQPTGDEGRKMPG